MGQLFQSLGIENLGIPETEDKNRPILGSLGIAVSLGDDFDFLEIFEIIEVRDSS